MFGLKAALVRLRYRRRWGLLAAAAEAAADKATADVDRGERDQRSWRRRSHQSDGIRAMDGRSAATPASPRSTA